jgi:molybdate transport system regulatory protein
MKDKPAAAISRIADAAIYALHSGPAAMAVPRATMRLHLWFETDEGMLFGIGRMLLLREMEACGSLKGAAEKLGMSYRGAWGKLRQTEEALGMELVSQGPCRRSGGELTPFGRELVKRFDAWYREVEDFALRTSARHLPIRLERYEEKG